MTYKGTKKVEIPYMVDNMIDGNTLIVGEVVAADQISSTILDKDIGNVTTTDIRSRPDDGWLNTNTNWKHILGDYITQDYDKYDNIIAISIFEHFGLIWDSKNMSDLTTNLDIINWNHDLRAIEKSCKLLKSENSRVIITLPVGPYMNYNDDGYPILRYYNRQRQNMIRDIINKNNCKLTNEVFYYSQNFEDWSFVGEEINDHQYYPAINPNSPNCIWAFCIQLV